MKKEVRFTIEATEDKYYGKEKVDLSATFEGSKFHFTVDADGDEAEFWVEREELVELIKATEPEPAPVKDYASQATNLCPISDEQAENWLRAHKGQVVEIAVRRKSGGTEYRHFEVYSIKGGNVAAWQQEHNHFERFHLGQIAELEATGKTFEPRFDVEL